jgi:hypothetical protein
MAALSISQAWEETKARIASDGRLMMVVAAALILLPQTMVTLIAPPEMLSGIRPPNSFLWLAFVAALIGMVGQLAIIRLALGPATSVGEAMVLGAKRFLPAMVALLFLTLLLFAIAIPAVLLLAGTGGFDAAATGQGTGGLGIAILVILIAAILIGARFVMVLPVAAAEAGGPISILKRSWALARGHYLRLVAFIGLLIVVLLFVTLAVQIVAGLILNLLFEFEPFSVGALFYGLIAGAAQAALTVVFSVMLARIYLQLAGRGSLDVTVPNSGS